MDCVKDRDDERKRRTKGIGSHIIHFFGKRST